MTPDEVRTFVRRHLERFHQRDAAALATDHAVDGIVDSPSAGTCRGRPAIEHVYRVWFAAFPDMDFTQDDLVVENDHAALFFRHKGTHHGEFLGLSGTGKEVEFHGVFLQTLKDHQIVHEQRIYDFSGLLVRLGVLKVKPG